MVQITEEITSHYLTQWWPGSLIVLNHFPWNNFISFWNIICKSICFDKTCIVNPQYLAVRVQLTPSTQIVFKWIAIILAVNSPSSSFLAIVPAPMMASWQWKGFPHYWPAVKRRSCRVLMFSLMSCWTAYLTNSRCVGDLRPLTLIWRRRNAGCQGDVHR